ncbi:MAG: chromosomal replication initiator protein DnaA [Dehalococcoidia bacterium]|nr:chromosomal replication initiator protein DnaA [Dehalococcoidia bacterium]MDP7231284.1 chromosomal replication initiator protein DnaA [Dehalococcoidia bacterium]MDP7613310.1 chromosomal replication initiator protein DnaA [Dehalococcoidia bacterium]
MSQNGGVRLERKEWMAANNAKKIWSAVLGQLQLEIPRPNFETWLRDTSVESLVDGKLNIYTPSPFAAEMLEKRLLSSISNAVNRVTGENLEVLFHVTSKDPKTKKPYKPEFHHNSTSRTVQKKRLKLNPKFTFDDYVRGPENELALAAAVKVSEQPGKVYNPVYIYSKVGLGKTHLMQSIGHALEQQGKSVIYVTSETFTNEYIAAIRKGKSAEFRKKYRNVDALLIDDIQFVSTKEQTQEGFFHTFNELHLAQKQIVVSGDEPSNKIHLQERIKSRLGGGLELDIQPPNYETRLAILTHKASNIDNDVIEMLANIPYKNVRDLEGALNRVIAYSDLVGARITLELAEYAIKSLFSEPTSSKPDTEEILKAVEKITGVAIETIKGNRRDKTSSTARRIAMYLLREDAHLTSTSIGQLLGNKDHSTVIYGQKAIEKTLIKDYVLREQISSIRSLVVSYVN